MSSLLRMKGDKAAVQEFNWIFPLPKSDYEVEDAEDFLKITSPTEGKIYTLKFKGVK